MQRAVLPLLMLVGIPPVLSAQATALPTDPEGVPLPAGAVARIGSARFRHQDMIQPLAFSPDGRTLFVGTVNHDALYAWDPNGRLRWRVTFAERTPGQPPAGRTLDPRDLGFGGADVLVVLPDGQRREGVVRFDQNTGRETGRVAFEPPTVVDEYRFSRDGSKVAVSHEQDLAVYDTATGRRLFARRIENGISTRDGRDFSPDGTTLAVGDYKGGVHLLRSDTGRPVWDVATGLGAGPIGVRFAADGRTLAARSMTIPWHPVLVLDPDTGAVRQRLRVPGKSDWHVWSWAPARGAGLFIACRVYPEDGGREDVLILWDTSTGKELQRSPCALPFHVAVGSGGKVVATADGFCVVLLELKTGKLLSQSADPIGGYDKVWQRPDGRWVALGPLYQDTFDESGRRLSRLFPAPRSSANGQTALSPDGKTSAVVVNHENDLINGRKPVSDILAYLYEVPSGREVGRLRGPDGSATTVTFSPDGRMVVTTGLGRPARLWEVATLGQRHTFPHGPIVRTAAFSLNGRLLATDGADAPAYLWDVYGNLTRTGPQPDAAALDAAWVGLTSHNAAAGFQAVRTLAAAPGESVRLLRERLKPETRPDPAVVRRWITELDSPVFGVREKATAELTAAVEHTEPALRKAVAGAPSPEARRRLEAILARAKEPSPATLRAARGVEALEVIGTPAAQELLGTWARGPAGHRLTVEAKRSLARASAHRPGRQ